jgi:hypothetical protein
LLIFDLSINQQTNAMSEITNEEIEKAKAVLSDAGYFVDNLWHIDDVKKDHSVTDDEAMQILEYALTGEGTYSTIWDAIADGFDYVCPQNDDDDDNV